MSLVLTYFWLRWVLLHIWLSFTIHYFIFHFKCCRILHFAVCQHLCWAFLLIFVKVRRVRVIVTDTRAHREMNKPIAISDIVQLSLKTVGNFHLTFEISIKVTNLECEKNKSIQSSWNRTKLSTTCFEQTFGVRCSNKSNSTMRKARVSRQICRYIRCLCNLFYNKRITKEIWPWKWRSRSRSTPYVMVPFDDKYQSL